VRHPDPSGPSLPNDGSGQGLSGPSLGEVLAWLDRHVDLEAIESGKAGRAAEPTLERVRSLTAAMGEPQRSYPVIHVTGTNGKGSTTRLCSQLLIEQGLSVGTYTSPHLERLNERIAYGGTPISDDEFAAQLAATRELERFVLERHPAQLPPTWFELVTAAAFRYFADVAAEAAVVEVGLGGRYDATNVADGSVAVLTNVELDHTEILGSSREQIAAEKAGIIKPGAIVCCGEDSPAIVELVAAEARAAGAEAIWVRNVDFGCDANRVAHGGRLLDLRTPGASYEELYLPLHGAHQGDNAAVALAAAEAFFGTALERDVVELAFAGIKIPGRLEVVGRHPLVVLDGAHNPAGAAALGASLAEDFAGSGPVRLVFGCLRGRDPEAMLEAIGPELIGDVYACRPPSPRAQPAEAVVAAAARLGLRARPFDGVLEALEAAHGEAAGDELVLVSGSLYTVGAARAEARRLGSKKT